MYNECTQFWMLLFFCKNIFKNTKTLSVVLQHFPMYESSNTKNLAQLFFLGLFFFWVADMVIIRVQQQYVFSSAHKSLHLCTCTPVNLDNLAKVLSGCLYALSCSSLFTVTPPVLPHLPANTLKSLSCSCLWSVPVNLCC